MGSTFYSKRLPNRNTPRRDRARPKTFATEEAAKKWAEKQGLKDYKIVNMKSPESKTKKLKVIAK
ncbi:MAG: hypothetical protein V3V78_02800 [Candidatus Woesearchaeota archaeon]